MIFGQLSVGDKFYCNGNEYIKTELERNNAGFINSTCIDGYNAGFYHYFDDGEKISLRKEYCND